MDDARVRQVYQKYSSQKLEALLTFIADDVDWPDGEKRMHGKDEIRSYWMEQWSRTRTEDVPTVIARLSPSVCVVRIDQVVRSTDGHVISRGSFAHVLHLDGQLISRLDIVPLQQ